MRLIEKFILLILMMSLPPLIIAGGFFYYSIRNSLENQTTAHLNSVATIQKNRIKDIQAQNLKRLADFTSRERLRELMDIYARTNDKKNLVQINTILQSASGISNDIESITIRNSKGQILVSTEKDTEISQLELSQGTNPSPSQNSIRLISQPGAENPSFYLNGPLMRQGKAVGSVSMIIKTDELRQTVSDYTGLGETGEIALGRQLKDGRVAFIMPLRFDRQATDKIISDNAVPMFSALKGEEKVFTSVTDYRNHDVVAATRYINENGWGLVAKIDRSEALQPLQRIRNEIILLAFINSVVVVFAAMALARRFIQPIIDIEGVAERTSRGNLNSRVTIISKDEIGNLARTFNHMLDNLEEFDKAKSDFVSIASHQLRSPLTSIKWATEELTDSKAALGKTKRRHYLQQIHASNERMIELVEALLNVSRIDVGKLPFKKEPVQLEEKLDQIISDLSAMSQAKDVVINKKIDVKLASIEIDPNWINVIIQNLLSNAIRYSKKGQSIYTSIEQKAKYVVIKVEDSGYGIPASQQANIFTKFYRADNAHALGSEGSGLGLYITKSMVERAGGKIWFESIEGKGTTFYVKLPNGT